MKRTCRRWPSWSIASWTGHPAADHPRPLPTLAEACLGPRAVWNVVVAERDGRLIGFVGWKPLFDLFWSARGGWVDWLYVCPESRGLGVPLQLIARVCAAVRADGGTFVHGTYGAHHAGLYEQLVQRGSGVREASIGEQRFQGLADHADADVRDLVRFTRDTVRSGK